MDLVFDVFKKVFGIELEFFEEYKVINKIGIVGISDFKENIKVGCIVRSFRKLV